MSLIDYLYPKHCPVCLTALPPGKRLICPPCVNKIRYVRGATCFKCGKPLSDPTREYCRNCEKRMPSFREGLSWAEYTSFYTRQLMSEVKYHGNRQLLDFPCLDFSEKNAAKIRSWNAVALIPVPVHKSRLKERGYNQAEEIALRLSRHLGIPVLTNVLLRNGKTTQQKKLSNEDRALNLYGAFSVEEKPPEGAVILVDDIYTTGATAEVCTKALLSAGAGEVYFISLAIGHDDTRSL